MISSYEDLKRLNDHHRQPCSIFKLPGRDFVRLRMRPHLRRSLPVSKSIRNHISCSGEFGILL